MDQACLLLLGLLIVFGELFELGFRVMVNFCVDLIRLRPAGDPPSPRAAHVAAAVGTMVVFQVIKMTGFFF